MGTRVGRKEARQARFVFRSSTWFLLFSLNWIARWRWLALPPLSLGGYLAKSRRTQAELQSKEEEASEEIFPWTRFPLSLLPFSSLSLYDFSLPLRVSFPPFLFGRVPRPPRKQFHFACPPFLP